MAPFGIDGRTIETRLHQVLLIQLAQMLVYFFLCFPGSMKRKKMGQNMFCSSLKGLLLWADLRLPVFAAEL